MIRLAFVIGIVTSATTGFLTQSHDRTDSRRSIPAVSNGTHSAPRNQRSDLNSRLVISDQLHGVVKPFRTADLPSLVAGIIVEVHANEGQFVKKGTPLVTLDDRIPKARLAAATVEANLTGALQRAEVELKMAESRLGRIRSVLNKGAGANFELEEAEGTRDQAAAAVSQQKDVLKAAEATRQLAEAQLHQYTIVAPFDGLITEIHRKSGAVDPSQDVISIANLSVLEVEMHVPSRHFGSIRAGDRLPLEASAPVSRRIEASVLSVSPIINSASQTFRCLLQIDNGNRRLPAGFTVLLQNNGSAARQQASDVKASTHKSTERLEQPAALKLSANQR